eukprot:1974948-Karenia_brevis.AAC.1
MATAPTEIRDRFYTLLQNPSGCCKMCGKTMSSPTFHVVDGGQAYETIYPNSVRNDLKYLLGLAVSTGNGLSGGGFNNNIYSRACIS